jgi:hypothetical protein
MNCALVGYRRLVKAQKRDKYYFLTWGKLIKIFTFYEGSTVVLFEKKIGCCLYFFIIEPKRNFLAVPQTSLAPTFEVVDRRVGSF